MTDFYAEHRETLDRALETIRTRTYWSPYPEHPKAYGEDAPGEGRAAFEARLGAPFALDQPASGGMLVPDEASPYGLELGITYPRAGVDELVAAAETAMGPWAKATPEVRAGVLLELLARLAARSFEMAEAVMHTTGQSFLMAFQAGGPHALDRGLEALAYAYREQTSVPRSVIWEKPQGKRPPLVVSKEWRIRPRGVAVTIGVSTFPTWNGYPGIFASLATGNPVIVKPHPATILPLAIFVEIAREVLAEAGFDPNLVTLAVDTRAEPITRELVLHPAVGIVDYTGGPEFGRWLEEHVRHAAVFTEKAGVNSVIVDSAEDLGAVFRNLSVSTTMYSGQMCTSPQDVFVPADGVRVGDEVVAFEAVARGLADAIAGLLADDARACEILGAIKDPEAVAARIEAAAAAGEVLLESREITHPAFPEATVRTPVVVAVDAADRDAYAREFFGPVVLVVRTASTDESIERARAAALDEGAITWLAYTTDPAVEQRIVEAAVDAGVGVAFNLTGGLFVNQSAAFSDFHVTGANPAGNASLTDTAFVANRFRFVGIRRQ
ncbi:MAG TPA: phenylacetic acid degradation protein PaaN [Actinobacteria bacterium]|nr:phenylacetic acid degradation protein PaaN [Actinomycetota bacterium]